MNGSLKPDWTDEPFGDHHSALGPIAHSPDYRQTTHSGVDDDEDDIRGLVGGSTGSRDESTNRNGSATASPVAVVRQLTRSFSARKAPPPPPARRTTSTSAHRTTSSAGNTATASPFLTPTNPTTKPWNTSGSSPKGGETGREYEANKSPFDEGDGDRELFPSSLSCTNVENALGMIPNKVYSRRMGRATLAFITIVNPFLKSAILLPNSFLPSLILEDITPPSQFPCTAISASSRCNILVSLFDSS